MGVFKRRTWPIDGPELKLALAANTFPLHVVLQQAH